MKHTSTNRPSHDLHYFFIFNTVHEVLNFLKNFLGSISPKIIQKLKMILLDVINLDEILTGNSMCQNKFFEPCAKLGAILVSKL